MHLPLLILMGISAFAVECQCSRCPGEKRRSSALTVAEINGGTATWKRWSVRQITNSSVLIVVRPLQPMGIKTENIAPTNVISQTDLGVAVMTKEQMDNESMYHATMIMVKNLLKMGAITEEEYSKIETNFRAKFQVSLSTLFTDIDLIKCEIYGNM